MVNSTWAAGTFPVVDMTAAYGPGNYGAIEVYADLELPEPPNIWTQPHSTTNFCGQSATFSVISTPYQGTYQWQVNGTNLYDGPHVSSSLTYGVCSLTLNPITLADAGSYRVILS